jgi:hypothetical protein
MAKEPTYPEDSPVGEGAGKEAPAAAAEEKSGEAPGRRRHLVTGAAIGIGSAALVAALLYANRSRKGGNKAS